MVWGHVAGHDEPSHDSQSPRLAVASVGHYPVVRSDSDRGVPLP